MPTRFIKESCRTSKNLHAVADFSERVFWRLLTTADDYGRCLACPAIVKSHCFPLQEKLSNARIATALHDLATHNLLRLYRVDDREYAEFVTFEKHQGAPRAKTSKYPPASACMQMLASANNSVSTPNTDTHTDLSSLPPSSDLKSTNHSNGRDYRSESKIILAFLNEKTGKQFREVEANLGFIESRLKSGVDVQVCKTLIARKVREWTAKPDMVGYLRPETLFNKTKFETYLAEVTQ